MLHEYQGRFGESWGEVLELVILLGITRVWEDWTLYFRNSLRKLYLRVHGSWGRGLQLPLVPRDPSGLARTKMPFNLLQLGREPGVKASLLPWDFGRDLLPSFRIPIPIRKSLHTKHQRPKFEIKRTSFPLEASKDRHPNDKLKVGSLVNGFSLRILTLKEVN